MSNNQNKEPKKPTLLVALIPILAVVVFLLLSLFKFEVDVQIPLILATIVTALVGKFALNRSWGEMEKGMIDAIGNAMQAILILCFIGMVIGSWMAGGVVQSLIYYGLKILSPKVFLLTTFIICSIVSLATGSSWTTAGTMGVALMGIGIPMGLPAAAIAGAVVSGAYFGDGVSPFSDCVNMAPAVSGTTLFAHTRAQVKKVIVPYIVTCVIFLVMNLFYTADSANKAAVQDVLDSLKANFTISPLLILPIIIIIVMIALKLPAIPGLLIGILLGAVCAVFVQGVGISDFAWAIEDGFSVETGNELLDNLLNRGGLQSVMWTVSLMFCALSLGGVMSVTGMLETIAENLLKLAKGNGSLNAITILTGFFVNGFTGEQYVSILLTGRMFKDEYKKRDLAPTELSSTVGVSSAITPALVPWSTDGVAMAQYCSVATIAYLPFAVYCWICPIINVITGFIFKNNMLKRSEVPAEDLLDD